MHPNQQIHSHWPVRPSAWLALALALAWLVLPAEAVADRIKDLARVAGVRDNQLVGYGLVVGLDGTGDQTGQAQFTVQSLKSMLNRLGVQIPPGVNPQLKNVAAVALSATLPPFAKPGQSIDITASTIGNAKSIRGGTLLLSPLKGADGYVYAMAQGNLIVGGFGAATNDGNSISVNIPTVGRIPNGATIERPAPSAFGQGDFMYLNLHRPDFTTAQNMADAINKALGEGMALPADGSTVRLNAPREASQRVSYLAFIENLELEPGSPSAKVIVNSRTGTVVIGEHVNVSAAAVAHGNLSVTVSNTTSVSQPVPFGDGDTRVVPNSDISFREEPSRAFLFEPGVTLEEIVRAINQVGAAPSDIVAILEALKEAGALRAELMVI
jgi:flagellar P-ring protein precursor FlgI